MRQRRRRSRRLSDLRGAAVVLTEVAALTEASGSERSDGGACGGGARGGGGAHGRTTALSDGRGACGGGEWRGDAVRWSQVGRVHPPYFCGLVDPGSKRNIPLQGPTHPTHP